MNVLDKLLFNLQTIASVPKGKRIGTTKEFIVIEEESPMQGFWRWKYSDSRIIASRCICREVRTTIVMAQYILESTYLAMPESPPTDFLVGRASRIITLKKIRIGLIGAATGVNNICQTYESDADFAGNLRPLISEINTCVATITTTLKHMGESTELENTCFQQL